MKKGRHSRGRRRFLLDLAGNETAKFADGPHLEKFLVFNPNLEQILQKEHRFGDRQGIVPEVLDQPHFVGQWGFGRLRHVIAHDGEDHHVQRGDITGGSKTPVGVPNLKGKPLQLGDGIRN